MEICWHDLDTNSRLAIYIWGARFSMEKQLAFYICIHFSLTDRSDTLTSPSKPDYQNLLMACSDLVLASWIYGNFLFGKRFGRLIGDVSAL